MSDYDDYELPAPKPKRKVLLARISELEASLAAARAEIRERPPVFVVDGGSVEGCAVILTDAAAVRDAVGYDGGGGFVKHAPGPWRLTLQATGPFPVDSEYWRGLGEYWLVPKAKP